MQGVGTYLDKGQWTNAEISKSLGIDIFGPVSTGLGLNIH